MDVTLANEGVAISRLCVAGQRDVFYADDSDTDGHSLRRAQLDCVESVTEPTPDPEPTSKPEPTKPADPVKPKLGLPETGA